MFRRDSRVLFFSRFCFPLLLLHDYIVDSHFMKFQAFTAMNLIVKQAATENCVWRILKLFSYFTLELISRNVYLSSARAPGKSQLCCCTHYSKRSDGKKNGSAFRILTHGHYFNVQSIVKTQTKLASKWRVKRENFFLRIIYENLCCPRCER